MERGRAWVAGCVGVAAVLLAGCGGSGGGNEDSSALARPTASVQTTAAGTADADKAPAPPDSSVLTFAYHRQNDHEYIDQSLEIDNSDKRSVVPVLAFTALDRNHNPLPDVRVSSVLGSDSGRLVATYGYTLDILRFSGSGQHQVYDVRVTVRHLAAARQRANITPVAVEPLDGAGHVVSKFDRFAAVRLKNQDRFPVSVRVAYVAYDKPAEGNTQQPVSVSTVGGLVHLPALGTAVVKVTGAAAQAVDRYSGGTAVTIRAYNSQ